ncbi:MAG TPA: acyltransferase, partial [Ruminococcus bicirculans (ex Wegman et al. 2014)]|nr:acyltransferase [Ruminococcus bicirculans (ex Wegman et al. 2014)]
MVYSDLIFILGMFPIMTIISLFDRSAEYKNLILIVCSLLFFSWGRPFVFCLIFLSVILDWIFGLIISKNRENKALCGIFL